MRQKFNDTYDARASQRASAVASNETREGSAREASSHGRKARGEQDERAARRARGTQEERRSRRSRDMGSSRDGQQASSSRTPRTESARFHARSREDAQTNTFDASQEEQQLSATHRKRRIRSARVRTDVPAPSADVTTQQAAPVHRRSRRRSHEL